MAYILTPRFAHTHQAPQCNAFGFCTPQARPTHDYRAAWSHQLECQYRHLPVADIFSQLVSEIYRESQHQAQLKAQREAQRRLYIEARRKSYIEHIEAQQAVYRQRQAQIEVFIEAQHEANRQRQLRKNDLNAKFSVSQNEQGWQIDAEIPGFEQNDISIEIMDENTLKIASNNARGSGPGVETPSGSEASPTVQQSTEKTIQQPADEMVEDCKLEPVDESATTVAGSVETTEITEITEVKTSRPSTPDNDASSQKSYQATVEDDFEDLGPETSILFSTKSLPTAPTASKGKEKATEFTNEHRETFEDPEVSIPTETSVTEQTLPKAPMQHQQEEFERTFRFPGRIDTSRVRASLREGILNISVPTAQVQQVRKIAIL